ncbi:MAG: 4Fe-4S binding protein, partial [Bacteroidales bacterium]|nr:4Fe-4S binding protein [Bacteroidales bacterium]
CKAACIGCAKCQKVCPFEAIKVENNLAYIDFNVCKLCTKCVSECPTGAIHKFNFPEKPAAPAAAPAAPVEKAAPAAVKAEVKAKEETV